MTIRLKLTLYWAAVLAAILIIAGTAVFLLFQRSQWGELDSALMEEADTSTATLAHAGKGIEAAALVKRLSEERDLGPRRRVRLVAAGEVIADFGERTAALPLLPAVVAAPGMFERGSFRFAVMPFTLSGRRAYLEDGVDASRIRDSVRRLRSSLLLILPMLLLGCVAGGYWLAGRALAPMAALGEALARIEPRELGRRLDAGETDDEVARLTAAINALLERLERVSLSERRFASDAAHELRTPLTVLRTGLEVALSRERTAPEYRRQLELAMDEVLRLCRVADELLMLARLDGEVEVEREPVDMKALITEVTGAVEPLVQIKNLTLRSTGDHKVMVNGNRGHLRRLVINLLDNALKFTPEHGVVTVGLSAEDNRAVLRIADSGPGIAVHELPLIFDRFFRGKTGQYAGSGLGLSLCREIARRHGGEIRAHNCADGGSEFLVTIPLAHSGSDGKAVMAADLS
ncbi:MAG: ATP-binding protein [Candidatus Binataceae bacterium]